MTNLHRGEFSQYKITSQDGEEYGRIIEELNNHDAGEVLTIVYHDGLNYFEIINN